MALNPCPTPFPKPCTADINFPPPLHAVPVCMSLPPDFTRINYRRAKEGTF